MKIFTRKYENFTLTKTYYIVVKFIFFVLMFCLIFQTSKKLFAETMATSTTVANGSWATASIWNPAVCPILTDDITIKHSVANFTNPTLSGSILIESSGTLSSLNMTVSNASILLVYGTLNLSSLTLNNGSSVHVFSSGVVAVSGDFFNKNNTTNIIIDGNLIVGGSFTNGFGGTITGDGIISVSGVYDGSGSTFGIMPTSLIPPNSSISSPLPIELLEFGVIASGNNVIINWKTSSEINCNYFTIKKSNDGFTFFDLAKIKANGNSNITCSYSYCDENLSSGIKYYMLVQTDFDGKAKAYNICTLNIENLPSEIKDISVFSIGPNPFNNEFKISLSSSEAISVNVILVDDNGKTLYSKSQKLIEGNNEFRVTCSSSFKSGLYFVYILKENEGLFCNKMIKTASK